MYNPSDFCSKPGVTMEELRHEQMQQIQTYVGYVEQLVAEAQKMGMDISFNHYIGPSEDEKILIDQEDLSYLVTAQVWLEMLWPHITKKMLKRMFASFGTRQ